MVWSRQSYVSKTDLDTDMNLSWGSHLCLTAGCISDMKLVTFAPLWQHPSVTIVQMQRHNGELSRPQNTATHLECCPGLCAAEACHCWAYPAHIA